MKKIFTLTAILVFVLYSYSQENTVVEIEGPSPVSQGSTHWYILEMEGLPTGPLIPITVTGGGSLIQVIATSTRYDIQVQWTASGQIRYERGSTLYAQKLVSVTEPPIPPTPNTAININYDCGSTTVTRSANPPSGVTWYWQTLPAGTSTSLGSGANRTITSQQNIYLRAYKSSTGNWSTGSLDVGNVPVNPIPGLASGSGASRCDGGSISLTASPGTNANSIRWYESLLDQVPEHTGLTYTPTISSTTTYYAASYNTNTGCESSTRKAITATIVELSNAGTLTGATEKFAIASGTLNLGGTIVGDIVKWQKKTTGGWEDIAETDNSYPYTNIQESTYFRVIVQNGICDPVPSNEVFINILPMLTMDIGDFENLRPGHQTVLTIDQGHSSYQWFKNDVIIPNETSYQLMVDRPGEYKVEVTSSGGADTTGIAVIGNQLKPNENSVITYTYLTPSTVEQNPYTLELNEQSISAQIYDGLGRPIQTISMNSSPNEMDIVAPVEYDELGKKSKSYLPYIDDNLQSIFKANALNTLDYATSAHYDYYYNSSYVTDKAYSEIRFEPSPLNRPLEQGAPGEAWQIGQNTVKFQYDVADSAEVLLFKSETLLTALEQVYDAGQLYKNTTTDEDGNSTIEYTNKQGQTILKKSQVDTNTWAETYYIYDIYGNLSVVLPPEATFRLDAEFFQTGADRVAFLNTWAFLYDYDGRNRMTMKKVPGAESIFMVYDKWDRLVLTQDGEQRDSSDWLFTKYDALNRPIMTGIVTISGTTQQVRDGVTASNIRFDTLNTTFTNGYSNQSYPTSGIDEYLTVTYYDNYDWDTTGLSFISPTGLTMNTAVKGLLTGTLTRSGDGTWIKSASYYDNKYRVIQSQSTNHLGGKDVVSNYLDFIGQVKKAVSSHFNGDTTYVTERRFEYDHAGRLLKIWHKLASATDSTLIVGNRYNELGELEEKDLHHGVQTMNYSYNIRGWLTGINGSDLSASQDGDLFGMDIIYNEIDNDINNTGFYNGNIGGMKWSVLSDQKNVDIVARGYRFDYDGLNRLENAKSNRKKTSWSTSAQYKTDYNYDLNGNLLRLERRPASSVNMDSLTYIYDGNKLLSVTDGSLDSLGFFDGNTTGDDYTYDANGNMTKDRNKGIDSIYYNHLNLPIKVEFESSGDSITYLYDAAGIKLNQVVYKGGDTLKVTDYVGEFIYETDTSGVRKLQLIQHEEGRIVPKYALDGSTIEKYDYQYHLKDHLGNVRVTFSTEPENYEMIETFETGEENGWQDLHRHTNTDANTTSGGDEVERLQSGQTGAMIFLSVNKRDTINLSVQANYESAPSGNNFLGTAYNTLFTSFDNVYGSGVPEGGGVSSSSTVFDDALNGGAMAGKDDSNTAPRAFLNYIFFDKDMNYVNAGFTQITTAAQGVGVHEEVLLDIPPFEQDGYILAYLSNENLEAVNVHFDDFTIYHGKTNVVSTQDYYPFGLTFNESVRVASVANRFKYNSFEYMDDLNLNLYDYQARYYDPAIGRFINVDPAADLMRRHSPYNYAFDNPIRYIDPDGMMPQQGDQQGDKKNKSSFKEERKAHAKARLKQAQELQEGFTQFLGLVDEAFGGNLQIMFMGATGQFDDSAPKMKSNKTTKVIDADEMFEILDVMDLRPEVKTKKTSNERLTDERNSNTKENTSNVPSASDEVSETTTNATTDALNASKEPIIGTSTVVEISAAGDTTVTVTENAASGSQNEIDTVRHEN